MFTGVSAFQMGLIHIIAGMMGAGVFERYPRLRVSFGESGAGWLAYALHRMDFEFEDKIRRLLIGSTARTDVAPKQPSSAAPTVEAVRE